jgi:hypothetical protein
MRELERRSLRRHLAGFENRLKAGDRVKEKVADSLAVKGRTVQEAMKLIPDAVRFTFQYPCAQYTRWAGSDILRMWEDFDLVRLRNFWQGDQYKGISSTWRTPANGQLFEVRFHSDISYEAHQITQPAYERLRHPMVTKAERQELEAFLRKVYAKVPVPPRADHIRGYSPHADQGIPGRRSTPGSEHEGNVPDVTYYAIVDDLSSREQPAGVLRRSYFDDGRRDEAFTRGLVWKPSPLLISAERGDLENEFVEITTKEAIQIIDRISSPQPPAAVSAPQSDQPPPR